MNRAGRFSLIAFDLGFVVLVGIVSAFGKLPTIPDWLFWVLLGFATFRAGRAISFNRIFLWLRDLVGIVPEPDSSGAGDSNVVRSEGVKGELAELIACPICSGTWAGMILILLVSVTDQFGRVLVFGLGSAGIAEILHWASESFEWGGRSKREQAGSLWLQKNEKPSFDHLFEIPFFEEIGAEDE